MKYFTIENSELMTTFSFTLPPSMTFTKHVLWELLHNKCRVHVVYYENNSPKNFKTWAYFEDTSIFSKFFMKELSQAICNFYHPDDVNSEWLSLHSFQVEVCYWEGKKKKITAGNLPRNFTRWQSKRPIFHRHLMKTWFRGFSVLEITLPTKDRQKQWICAVKAYNQSRIKKMKIFIAH